MIILIIFPEAELFLNLPPIYSSFKSFFTSKSFIRVNERWRIIFKWKESGPSDVRIINYHY